MNNALSQALWQQMWQGLYHDSMPLSPLHLKGGQGLSSAFPVTELAATSIGLAAQACARLIGSHHPVEVDTQLAARWFQQMLRPLNRAMPPLWDPFSGDYATSDGWIRLHANAAHHRAAIERVLGAQADREAMQLAVATWNHDALEQAVVDNGGCAAALRSHDEWQLHPQGQSVRNEPLFATAQQLSAPAPRWRLPPARPLLGVRVLDLTRIIAGPVATRFLAGLGADVLRLDPPGWQEPALEEEVTPGKRCARLDLKSAAGRQQFEQLLKECDVLVHGYRADALPALGYDSAALQAIRPGLVDVSLNAWGWSGPWRNRRGFDSLVQMACGIAERGRQWQQQEAPVPLPVQALDHATGYLMAAAVLEGLRQRLQHNTGFSARLSLARTACLLTDAPYAPNRAPVGMGPRLPKDEDAEALISELGLACRLRSPFWLPGTPLLWSRPPSRLGSAPPVW